MLESGLRKMISIGVVITGFGFILPNIATLLMLIHSLSLHTVETVDYIYLLSGTLLYAISIILLVIVGGLIVFAGIQYFLGALSKRIIFFGVMVSSFYLLFLGTGSALILQEVTSLTLFLVTTAILIVASVTIYVGPSLRLKFAASIMGIISGFVLAAAASNPILDLALNLQIPFPGPFMSTAILEGSTIVVASIALILYSLLEEGEKPVMRGFMSIVSLTYGVGIFVGSLVLSLNLLNLIWKAPWELALYGQPEWILNVVIFWAASLGMLETGGIIFIISAFLGFMLAIQEYSRI